MLPRFREIVDLVKQGATLEAQQRILELEEAHLTLREENLRLREELAAIKQKLEIASTVVWEPPAYYRMKDGKKDGPFCQKCFDSDAKFVRLLTGYSHSDFFCAVCARGY